MPRRGGKKQSKKQKVQDIITAVDEFEVERPANTQDYSWKTSFAYKQGQYVVASSLIDKASGNSVPFPTILRSRHRVGHQGVSVAVPISELVAAQTNQSYRGWQDLIREEAESVNSMFQEHRKRFDFISLSRKNEQERLNQSCEVEQLREEMQSLADYAKSLGELFRGDVAQVNCSPFQVIVPSPTTGTEAKDIQQAKLGLSGVVAAAEEAAWSTRYAAIASQLLVGPCPNKQGPMYVNTVMKGSIEENRSHMAASLRESSCANAYQRALAADLRTSIDYLQTLPENQRPSALVDELSVDQWDPTSTVELAASWGPDRSVKARNLVWVKRADFWPEAKPVPVRRLAGHAKVNRPALIGPSTEEESRRVNIPPRQLRWENTSPAGSLSLELQNFTESFLANYQTAQSKFSDLINKIATGLGRFGEAEEKSLEDCATQHYRMKQIASDIEKVKCHTWAPVFTSWNNELARTEACLADLPTESILVDADVSMAKEWFDLVQRRQNPRRHFGLEVDQAFWKNQGATELSNWTESIPEHETVAKYWAAESESVQKASNSFLQRWNQHTGGKIPVYLEDVLAQLVASRLKTNERELENKKASQSQQTHVPSTDGPFDEATVDPQSESFPAGVRPSNDQDGPTGFTSDQSPADVKASTQVPPTCPEKRLSSSCDPATIYEPQIPIPDDCAGSEQLTSIASLKSNQTDRDMPGAGAIALGLSERMWDETTQDLLQPHEEERFGKPDGHGSTFKIQEESDLEPGGPSSEEVTEVESRSLATATPSRAPFPNAHSSEIKEVVSPSPCQSIATAHTDIHGTYPVTSEIHGRELVLDPTSQSSAKTISAPPKGAPLCPSAMRKANSFIGQGKERANYSQRRRSTFKPSVPVLAKGSKRFDAQDLTMSYKAGYQAARWKQQQISDAQSSIVREMAQTLHILPSPPVVIDSSPRATYTHSPSTVSPSSGFVASPFFGRYSFGQSSAASSREGSSNHELPPGSLQQLHYTGPLIVSSFAVPAHSRVRHDSVLEVSTGRSPYEGTTPDVSGPRHSPLRDTTYEDEEYRARFSDQYVGEEPGPMPERQSGRRFPSEDNDWEGSTDWLKPVGEPDSERHSHGRRRSC